VKFEKSMTQASTIETSTDLKKKLVTIVDLLTSEADVELLPDAEKACLLHPRTRAVVNSAELLFIPIFEWPHKQAVSEFFGKPVLDYTDLIPTWSNIDFSWRREAYRETASLTSFLAGVRLQDIDMSSVISLSLMGAINNSHLAATALGKLAERKLQRILVLAAPLTVTGGLVCSLVARHPAFAMRSWYAAIEDRTEQRPMPTTFQQPARWRPQLRYPRDTTGYWRKDANFSAQANTAKAEKTRVRNAFKLIPASATIKSVTRFYEKARNRLIKRVSPQLVEIVGTFGDGEKNSILQTAMGRTIRKGGVLVSTGSAYPLYTRHVKAVIRELARRKAVFTCMLIPPASEGLFDGMDCSIPFVIPNTALERWRAHEFQMIGDEIQARVDDYAALHDTAGRLGCSYGVRHSYYLSEVRAAFNTGVQIDRIFQEMEPKSVWIANARDANDGLVIKTANKYNIPVFTGFAALAVDNVISAPYFHPDVTWTAYGSSLEEIFLGRGHPSEKIVPTGAPHFDYLYRLDVDTIRNAFRRLHNVERDQTVVGVFTGRAVPEKEDDWVVHLAKWAASKNVVVLYKQHPDKSRRQYEVLEGKIKSLNVPNFIWSDMEIAESIACVDLAIVDHSTSAIEATILRKPLVQVRMSLPEITMIDYEEEGIALGANTADQLVDQIELLMRGPDRWPKSREKFLERYNWGDDGRASERIVDLLEEPPAQNLSLAPALLEAM
jgi:hypothetical protein